LKQRTGSRELEEKEDQDAVQKQRGRINGRAGKKNGMSNSREPNRTTGWVKDDR